MPRTRVTGRTPGPMTDRLLDRPSGPPAGRRSDPSASRLPGRGDRPLSGDRGCGLIAQGDYRLTTAEILYHFPDHPSLLQTYLWQDYDLAPRFPVLHGFLTFWRENLDGQLHSVRVAHRDLLGPGDFARIDAEYTLQ